jgi:hypothetical protein
MNSVVLTYGLNLHLFEGHTSLIITVYIRHPFQREAAR